MQSLVVRDLRGRPLFYLDSLEAEAARDVNGKVVAARESGGDRHPDLVRLGAAWMSGRSPVAARLAAERKVLLDLAPGDVDYPATQADFGIPDGQRSPYVADLVSKVKFTKKDRGYFFAENVNDALQIVVGAAPSDGSPPLVNPGFVSTQFITTGYALAAKLPRGLSENADFDLRKLTLRRLIDGLRLARENRIATLLQTSGNWNANNRIAATAKWNGGATANPLTDMFAALKASAIPSNALVMPEIAAQYFFQNANSSAMRDYVQSGGEMPRVLFARAKVLSGGSPAYLWAPGLPANVPLVRLATDDETDIPTLMTMRWLGEQPAAGAKNEERDTVEGVLVRCFDDPQGPGDKWIVAAHNDADVMLNSQVGALITGAMQ